MVNTEELNDDVSVFETNDKILLEFFKAVLTGADNVKLFCKMGNCISFCRECFKTDVEVNTDVSRESEIDTREAINEDSLEEANSELEDFDETNICKDSESKGTIINEEQLGNVMRQFGFSPKAEYLKVIVEEVNEKFCNKRMAIQFLAQVGWESLGFHYIEEIACAGNKCPGKYGKGAPGKQYCGRGFIQLSWPYNYKSASLGIYNDLRLYYNPDVVGHNVQVAYLVSQWYWDKRVMTAWGVGEDHFGYTTKAINGTLECSTRKNWVIAKRRYALYKRLAEAVGLKKIADERGCYPV